MSFGTTSGQAAARTGEQGAIPALGQGVGNLQTSANFFNTILGGNRANTMQLLQPDITRLKEQQQGALQGASTLMPRGGGRFQTLFQQPFAVNRQLGDLFAGMRSGAAPGLAGIGGQQAGVGQAAATNLFQQDLSKQQMTNQFISQMIQAAMGSGTGLGRAAMGV